jgi:regulator of cell morphogenesis and NO signaling
MFTRKINELVAQDSVFAWVLHFFGISFYKYSDQTLDQVCDEKGISKELFVSQIESLTELDKHQNNLVQIIDEYPVDLIIEYLKHSHHKFVKQRLPYLSELINALNEEHFVQAPEARDLKFIFPTFVKDFIEHLYEEEDELFSYIMWINRLLKTKQKTSAFDINQKIAKNALQTHALEHGQQMTGMEGIKKITNNYQPAATADLLIEVIYTELQQFEKELYTHAKIENEVFFPKALVLEQKLVQQQNNKLNLN